MGAVYRATDRLTGETVALKRVTTPTTKLKFGTHSGDYSPDVALAQEFKMLASLRHPNIVSVLDYGFDAERKPFFTMTLLHNAQKITEAGAQQPLERQIDLLIQMLQALSYLHRRGILHRDLKPANVMVVEEQIKVLDFGLSQLATPESGSVSPATAGTFAYMAPELLRDDPATPASDLYAVGMIAYEVFAGRYPFRNTNMAVMMMDVLNASADVFSIGVDHELALVLQRLLVKQSIERYHDANEVIRDLCFATKLPPPKESIEIRESFLQAAKFVGREREMAQLVGVLHKSHEGHGSAWLIGGESGVGKSRLVDELRTLALVQGILVIREQATAERSYPYQLWHNVFQTLALMIELTDEEAGVLKAVVSNLDTLLQREISDAAPLDPQAAQNRLFKVVLDLFRRVPQPIMLLLEDLHWAGSNSLALLHQVNQIVSELPALIVGNYRNDERPTLPIELPGVNILELERLTEGEIVELSTSMLEEGGRQPHIVDMLRRETEGNPFFLVEVVRALAEEAGELRYVGTMTLPQHIFTGGLQRLVERRLKRVPEMHQSMLHIAAIAGRLIDMNLLQAIGQSQPADNAFDRDAFLDVCASAAVLEIEDNQWRFAHEKLREGILSTLPAAARRELHQQVALTIEQLYPDTPDQFARLAHHWSNAGERSKELFYAESVGDRALSVGANIEAKAFFEQALAALTDLPESDENLRRRVDITLKLSRAAAFLPSENIPRLLQRALTAAETLHDEARRAYVLNSMGAYHYMGARMTRAFDYFSQGITIAEKLGLERLLMLPYNLSGRALVNSGEYARGAEQLAKGVALAEKLDDLELLAGSLAFCGIAAWFQGRRDEGTAYAERALALAEQIGHPTRIAANLLAIGFCHTFGGFFDTAIDPLQRALHIATESKVLDVMRLAHGNLGYIYLQQGDRRKATQYLDQCLLLAKGAEQLATHQPMYQGFRAEVDLQNNRWQEALERAEAALALAEQTQQPVSISMVKQSLSKILIAAGVPDWERAAQLLQDSRGFHARTNAQPFLAVSTLDLSQLYQARGQASDARRHLDEAIRLFEELDMQWHLQRARQVQAEL
jgi:serine/threonine protein kinase/tetratricopeptide (TPR) repeat protein